MEYEQPASLAPRVEGPTHLPVPSQQCVELDAYRQATTLMAAETPGAHGAVRVWGVDERRLATRRNARTAALIGTLAGSFVGSYWLGRFLPEPSVSALVMRLGLVFCALGAGLSTGLLFWETVLRRLRTAGVAMDDAGIAFSFGAERGRTALLSRPRTVSRQYPWRSILAVRTVFGAWLQVHTADGEMLFTPLLGYDRDSRQEIMAAICSRARLTVLPGHGWYAQPRCDVKPLIGIERFRERVLPAQQHPQDPAIAAPSPPAAVANHDREADAS